MMSRTPPQATASMGRFYRKNSDSESEKSENELKRNKETNIQEQKKKGKGKHKNNAGEMSKKLESLKRDILGNKSDNSMKRSGGYTADSEDKLKREGSSNDTDSYDEVETQRQDAKMQRCKDANDGSKCNEGKDRAVISQTTRKTSANTTTNKRKQFEAVVDEMEMEIDTSGMNKRKKEIKCNGNVDTQNKRVKQSIVEIEDLVELDDPEETTVQYRRIEVLQSEKSNQSCKSNECLNKVSAAQQNESAKSSEFSDFSVNRERSIESKAGLTKTSTQTDPSLEAIVVEQASKTKFGNSQVVYMKGVHTVITRINPITIQKEMNQIMLKHAKIERAGDSLRIYWDNEWEKRRLLKQTTIAHFEVVVTEPFKKSSLPNDIKRGIIFGVDQSLEDEEIREATAALSAKRISKKIGGKLIRTAQVLLCYEGEQELPNFTWIGYQRYKIKEFVLDPMRCFKCQRYGHKAISCNNKERCSLRSGKHNVKNCVKLNNEVGEKIEKSDTMCANCKETHPASYR